jgi:hypothetical protein
MKYDVIKNVQPVVKRYSQFSFFPACSKESNDALVRIALCLADRKSPFAEERNFGFKLKKIFAELNIKNKGLQDEILKGKHEEFNKILFECYQILHDLAFTNYTSKLNLYYSINQYLRTGENDDAIENEKKIKISAQLDELYQQIEKLEKTLFMDEATLELVAMESAKIHSWPEMKATSDPVI